MKKKYEEDVCRKHHDLLTFGAELGSMLRAASRTRASSVCRAFGVMPEACDAAAALCRISLMSPFSSPPSFVKNLKPFLLNGKWEAVMMMPPSYS